MTTEWEKQRTMVYIKKTTRDRLLDIGKKKESYDDIILKLLDYWEKHHE